MPGLVLLARSSSRLSVFSLEASARKNLLVTLGKELILKFLPKVIGNCTKSGVIFMGGIWIELNNTRSKFCFF